MTFADYFFISVLYFWASSTALSLGIGYYTVYRPVVAGLATGLILGDPFLGMSAGAVVNIVYMSFVSTGGSFKGDQCLTAVMAAAWAVVYGFSPAESAVLAYPFGFLGTLIWKYRLSINSIFVNGYEKEYERGNNPDISLYDGLYPQLLLYIMSSAVVAVSFLALNAAGAYAATYYSIIKGFLHGVAMFMVFASVAVLLLSLNNKKSLLVFAASFAVVLLTDLNTYVVLLFLIFLLLFISNKKIFCINKSDHKNNNIRKKDLVYSWFIWMNFSHSCYSYGRLQGMAYGHSMKNIFRKLYSREQEVSDAVHRHCEFFNTEPNMGTPIHGYIVAMEEEAAMKGENLDASYIKKGMMGIAAGLGDSFTQVVLTPLFISTSVMMCLDGKFLAAFLPIAALASCILAISFSGWLNGYYQGRESLLERINLVKNSKVKQYFHLIFPGILGAAAAKFFLVQGEASGENILLTVLSLAVSVAYAFFKYKRR
ncbi:MAG: PTS system mannose/fructose/sorbose family transporter subunit IID [Sedimentibacter sp.]|uniref:PTS system mannose/fructose/sorbose family transporter subunit IID n=1 Tax=Sedimentibacter sp. TaxID=1960295 RepID=UPI003158911C